jgi:hypothetical protein
VTDSNLSDFNANVIHDMQILGLVPSEVQQFLSESWANMAQNVEDEQFQVVVPRKKKNKLKQHIEPSKGFKVGPRSPH